jgi:hypothetical protein
MYLRRLRAATAVRSVLRPRVPGRRFRFSGWLVLGSLVALLALAGSASAEPPPLDGVRLGANFYPCAGQTDFTRPPLLSECLDAQGNRPSPVVTADCNPSGTSTITVTRNGFSTAPWEGNASLTMTATIGPQTHSARPAFQPFANDGVQTGSVGFPTGRLLSFETRFSLETSDGESWIQDGEGGLITDAANYGVCREFSGEVSGSPVFGNAPLTGFFYILNVGVYGWKAVIFSPDTGADASPIGEGEAYISNSFATSPGPTGTAVNAASGHVRQSLASTHREGPVPPTPGSQETPAGTNVEVEPLPGVDLSFGEVTAPGTTEVSLRTTVPPLPAGLQVGDPPAFYEITTTASFTGSVRVCVPYGAAPAGSDPVLMHFENGAWVPASAITFTVVPAVVCGDVSSLSPFAAVFAPPALQLGDIVADVEALIDAGLGARARDKLEDVAAKLNSAVARLARSPADRQGALGDLEGAAGDLASARRDGVAAGDALADRVAGTARNVAVLAIAEAEARLANATKIEGAKAALARGDSRRTSGRLKDAVAQYKDAVSKAEGA